MAAATLSLATCSTIDRFPETVALKGIVDLHAAEAEFHARNRHFGLLYELGPHDPKLINSGLANGAKGGYRFEIVVDKSAAPNYVIQARPLVWGQDGYRSFYSDQTRVVHESWVNEAAASHSPVVR